MKKTYEVDYEAKQVNMFDERWYEIALPNDKETLDMVTGFSEKSPNAVRFAVEQSEIKVYLRSVTTILGIINKGYQYDHWLKNVGHNAEIIMDRAGTLGTTVHDLIEQVLVGGKAIYDESIGVYAWERFMRWCILWKDFTAENKVEFDQDHVEFITYDLELGYAGQVDLILKVNGEWAIIDWKTGNHIKKADRQIIAYARSVEKQLGIKIKNGYVGWIPAEKPNKKGYRMIEVKNAKPVFDSFLAAKAMYDYENKKDRPKYRWYPTMVDLDYIGKNELVNWEV